MQRVATIDCFSLFVWGFLFVCSVYIRMFICKINKKEAINYLKSTDLSDKSESHFKTDFIIT